MPDRKRTPFADSVSVSRDRLQQRTTVEQLCENQRLARLSRRGVAGTMRQSVSVDRRRRSTTVCSFHGNSTHVGRSFVGRSAVLASRRSRRRRSSRIQRTTRRLVRLWHVFSCHLQFDTACDGTRYHRDGDTFSIEQQRINRLDHAHWFASEFRECSTVSFASSIFVCYISNSSNVFSFVSQLPVSLAPSNDQNLTLFDFACVSPRTCLYPCKLHQCRFNNQFLSVTELFISILVKLFTLFFYVIRIAIIYCVWKIRIEWSICRMSFRFSISEMAAVWFWNWVL